MGYPRLTLSGLTQICFVLLRGPLLEAVNEYDRLDKSGSSVDGLV